MPTTVIRPRRVSEHVLNMTGPPEALPAGPHIHLVLVCAELVDGSARKTRRSTRGR